MKHNRQDIQCTVRVSQPFLVFNPYDISSVPTGSFEFQLKPYNINKDDENITVKISA